MTSLTLVRRIAARPSIVFDALISAEGVSRWWGPDAGPVLAAEIDARVGGNFRVRFRTLGGSEHECFGRYSEIARPQRLAMSWRWLGGSEDPGESFLEFDLRAVPEGTELTLTHSQLFDEQSCSGHRQGWSGSLDKLEHHFLARRENIG